MIIHHRGVYPDRFDTPFGVGTLVFAKDCHHHCRGCFHEDRHNTDLYEEDIDVLFDKITSNPFTSGIILAGFEWTEQYDEMIAMIEKAESLNLQIILYTHYTIEDIKSKYSALLNHKEMYIKCGEYDNTLLSFTYTSYGIPLASTNQKIYKIGGDICGSNS